MIIPVLLFLFGFVLLIKGGDWFVDGATAIAKRFQVPEILIGATVVSIGTTLPEVMVSATSAVSGHGEIAYGNAIGSIICNTALIAALTVTIKPSTIDKESLKTPVVFFFIAALYYTFIAYTFGEYDRGSGLMLLTIFLIYMVLSAKQALRKTSIQKDFSADEKERKKETSLIHDVFFLVIGAGFIAIGANLLVENGTLIAKNLGIPESVIALTFVALGTSLPELVTAITSLVKGHGALSLGNIIGANFFNLVLVSGLSITLAPFSLPSSKLLAGFNSSLIVDVPLVFLTMGLLVIPALMKGKLSRSQGVILLVIYGGFCLYQFAG